MHEFNELINELTSLSKQFLLFSPLLLLLDVKGARVGKAPRLTKMQTNCSLPHAQGAWTPKSCRIFINSYFVSHQKTFLSQFICWTKLTFRVNVSAACLNSA